MTYVFVFLLPPALATAGAAKLLTATFSVGGRADSVRLWAAVGLLGFTGLFVFVIAFQGGWNFLVATHQLIVASAVALVGAIVLALKPPTRRRISGLLLFTAYPFALIVLMFTGAALAKLR
jgi:hypothetical protein